MQKSSSQQHNVKDFINYVSKHKRFLQDWQFFQLTVYEAEDAPKLGEFLQSLHFHIQNPQAWIHEIPETNQFLLFAPKMETLTLRKYEKTILENFSSTHVRTRLRGFDGDGIEQFAGILSSSIDNSDEIAQVALMRMRRMANVMMVVDDDIMITKQIEKALSGYGRVVSTNEAENFEKMYTENAPDILFLDIHLKTARGTDLLKKLNDKIDPSAYVVIISSDTKETLVHDIKLNGAKGFLVKPINRNTAMQHVMKAPTSVMRV